MSHPVTGQPQVITTTYTSTYPSSWSTGLMSCCEDMGICLCGTFLPCVLECKVAQDFGECCLLPCLPGTFIPIRTGTRERYHIKGSVLEDWVYTCCCPLCSLCQVARELKARR
ncbi:cornifelin [Protopterus annectens]|uniref:cornifelin n=1 Tax=Protopterus annectens TaxID=7888 RepID=UPI001CF92F84|nr:cornifelin [Protopterus annectens]